MCVIAHLGDTTIGLFDIHSDFTDSAHEIIGKTLINHQPLVVVLHRLLRVRDHGNRVIQAGAGEPREILTVGVGPEDEPTAEEGA